MSLVVWLPLNGNLNNYGLSDNGIVSSGVTLEDNGIIGKCYSSNGTGYINTGYGSGNTINNLSICCWFKFTTVENSKIVFGSPNGSNQRCYLGYISNKWCIAYGNVSWSTGNGSSLGATVNVWQHLCLTINNKQMKLYINGEEMGQTITLSTAPTFAGNIFAFDYGAGTGYRTKSCMNDFRVYDHCLSKKEIKEISKGLAVHYKLSGYGNPNLFKNSTTFNINGSDYSSYSTRQLGRIDILNNTRGNAYQWIESRVDNMSNIFNSTQTMTLSISVKVENATHSDATSKVGIDYRRSDHSHIISSSQQLILDGQWHRYALTIVSNNDGQTKSLLSYSFTNLNGATIYYKNIKYENGSTATPWLPHTSDTMYNKLGYNSTIEEDYSGFGNHGVKYGTITYDTSTPRYNTSTVFNSSAIASVPNPLNSGTPMFTISFWTKVSNLTSNMAFYNARTEVGYGIALFKIGSTLRFDDGNQWSPYNLPSANTWYHMAFVRDTTKRYIYINGEKVSETTTLGDLSKISNIGSIGMSSTGTASPGSNPVLGNMSDFRIYATALSEDDIKELYNASASIDKNGNAYAYEFDELSSPNITKKGIWSNNNYTEVTTKQASVTKTTLSANQIIEI